MFRVFSFFLSHIFFFVNVCATRALLCIFCPVAYSVISIPWTRISCGGRSQRCLLSALSCCRFPSCAHLPPLSVLSCLISPNTEVVKMFTRSFPFSSSLNYQNAARSIREQVRPANFFCILQVSAANAQLLIVNSRVKETRSPDCANLTRTKGLYREGYLLICTAKGHSV